MKFFDKLRKLIKPKNKNKRRTNSMTQAQFDRIVFAVRNLYTQDIAEATITALGDLVKEWGDLKKKCEPVQKPAEATTAPATEADNEEI